MRFSLAELLRGTVRPAALAFEGLRAVEREPRLDVALDLTALRLLEFTGGRETFRFVV